MTGDLPEHAMQRHTMYFCSLYLKTSRGSSKRRLHRRSPSTTDAVHSGCGFTEVAASRGWSLSRRGHRRHRIEYFHCAIQCDPGMYHPPATVTQGYNSGQITRALSLSWLQRHPCFSLRRRHRNNGLHTRWGSFQIRMPLESCLHPGNY